MHPVSARFNRASIDEDQRMNQLEFIVTYDNHSSKNLILNINEQQALVSAGLRDAESYSREYEEVDAPDFWTPLFHAWRENSRVGNEFDLRMDVGRIAECTLREGLEEDSGSFFDMSEKIYFQSVHAAYGRFFQKTLPAVALYPYGPILNTESAENVSSYHSKGEKREESSDLNIKNILLAIPLTIPAVITMLCAAALAALAILAAPLIYGGALLADSVCSDEPESPGFMSR